MVDILRKYFHTDRRVMDMRGLRKMTRNFLGNFSELDILTKQKMDESEIPIIQKLIEKNIAFTNEERDGFAYSLIQDFHIINQLGMIHADLKPDNILVVCFVI